MIRNEEFRAEFWWPCDAGVAVEWVNHKGAETVNIDHRRFIWQVEIFNFKIIQFKKKIDRAQK